MQLKTKELAQWIGVSPATVRLWTTEGYGDFLSPTGQGGDGRIRSFNEQDARIIAFINALKQQGQERDEIMRTLAQMKGESWRDLPPMPKAPAGVVTETINLETAETALITQRNALLREISLLEDNLEQERDKNQALEQALAEKRLQVTELTGQLEAAKARVDIIQAERKPASYWLQIIGVITIALVIIAAIAIVYMSSGVG